MAELVQYMKSLRQESEVSKKEILRGQQEKKVGFSRDLQQMREAMDGKV